MRLSVYALGREIATLGAVDDFKSPLIYHQGVAQITSFR